MMLYLYLILSVAFSQPRAQTFVLDQEVQAPRWMYDSTQKIKGGGVTVALVEAKRAFRAEKFSECVARIDEAWPQAVSLHPWLASQQLKCAFNLAQKGKGASESLNKALVRIDNSRDWLIMGPQSEALRKDYVEGTLLQMDRWSRSNRARAWDNFEKLQRMRSWMDRDQQSRMYRMAGEMAFIEQKLLVAADFYQRSLDQKDSEELRTKLDSLRGNLLQGSTLITNPKPTAIFDVEVGVSGDEKELYNRMQQALKGGDFVSACEDGVKILTQFPGGVRAKWAEDRIIESYLSVAAKNESQFRLIRERMLKQMLKVDGGRLFTWATTLFMRGYYADALDLAEKSKSLMGGHPDSVRIIRLASRAALFSGEYSTAVKMFETLALEYAGTPESAEAVFRLGLLYFRKGQYSEAAAFFERLLVLPSSDDFQYSGMYWLWRTQQKLKNPNSEEVGKRLAEKFPLTYYGLRARAELNGGVLTWPKTATKPGSVEVWLTDAERLGWERTQLLLKAGWFDEARAELNTWPPTISVQAQLLKVKLLATAFDYYGAILLGNTVWDQNPELLQAWNVKWVFPTEFKPTVEKEAKKNGVDPDLMFSVIRQESSFRVDVVSPAGASGLMQVVVPTAKEIAKDLKIKNNIDNATALFDPDLNIRIGAVYLNRLNKNFKGNVPLSLAAYNAGIGKVRKWMASRPELGDLESQQSYAPESEIWIDELPWNETSFYVKAILRNQIVYKLLSSGKVELSNPVWKSL